jgi:hypothetical protein
MTVAETVQSIIDNAIEVANDQSDAAASYAATAITAANSAATMGSPGFSFTPNPGDLGVYIPNVAQVNLEPTFQSLYDQIKNDLVAQFATFFATYFPNECDYLGAAEAWLCDVITNGTTGMPAAVENQIWERDRSRVLQDASRVEQELLEGWSAKGYAMPPGALVWAAYRVNADAQNKISQASRDVAIKQAEIKVETIKFAVGQAISLRVSAVQAASAYINALAKAADVGVQFSQQSANAQAELINAATNYYNARVRVEEIKYNVKEANAKFDLEAQKTDVLAFMQRAGNASAAASAAAEAAGAMAAAALNALHSQATLTSIENVEA